MNSTGRRRSTLTFASLAMALSLGLPVAVSAGQSVDTSSLNPVPPDAYTCQATGSGTICRAYFLDSGTGPVGEFCGADSDPIELVFDGTDARRATRYYDTNGDIVLRKVSEQIDAKLIDPATGRSIITTQIAEFTTTPTTPGDLDNAPFTQRGVVRFFAPSFGMLLIDVGRQSLSAGAETTLSESGKHPLDLYFAGDTSVFAKVCDALGSPGTPPLP